VPKRNEFIALRSTGGGGIKDGARTTNGRHVKEFEGKPFKQSQEKRGKDILSLSRGWRLKLGFIVIKYKF
jgi:hypothetical protein